MTQRSLRSSIVFLALCSLAMPTRADFIRRPEEADDFAWATRACKVRLGEIAKSNQGGNGTLCRVTAEVIAPLKGDCGKTIDLTFYTDAGPANPGVWAMRSGGTYLIQLSDSDERGRVLNAMPAMPGVIEPTFGFRLRDRLFAEWMALARAKPAEFRAAGVTEIGTLRDARGTEVVNDAADDDDAIVARAGLLAQYKMRLATDAARVVEVLDRDMLDELYQATATADFPGGRPQREAAGVRAVKGFDYALLLREGWKLEWIRRDYSAFFGIIWQARRRDCVPGLIALLDDPDARVRCHAASCLLHTVEGKNEFNPELWSKVEVEQIARWKAWWRDKGPAFVGSDAER